MESPGQPRRGRPLSFDRDAALHQAMLLFWRHGYEATSIADLTHAMGVSAPSLYTAFGDKRRLFLDAVERYLGGRDTPVRAIAQAPSAEAAARAMLEAAATAFTGPDTPPGCLLATAAISCSQAAADVQAELAAIRRAIETALRRRIEADITAARLPEDTDAEALAATIIALIQGLSTAARDGAPRPKLLRLIETAMRAWPGPPNPSP